MTRPETKIVCLLVKNLPNKYFVHRPNMFGKTVMLMLCLWLKLLCLNFRQYVKDLTKNHAKSMFVATRVRCRYFELVSTVNKACRPQKHCLLIRCQATLAPDFRLLKNLLLRPRDKFSKQVWHPRRKLCSNNQNNPTNQPLGQKYHPEKATNGLRP